MAVSAVAQVAVQNSQQVTMYNTTLIHVELGSAAGSAFSEIINFGNINPQTTAPSQTSYGAGYLSGGSPGTPTDYWTLLFSNVPAANPGQVIYAIPPTISNITQNESGQTITFNVQTDGECSIANPTYPDGPAVLWAPLGSSAAYAFLSQGQAQSGTASTASKPAQLSARA